MSTSLLDPLLPGEHYLQLSMAVDPAMPAVAESQVRIQALAELLRRAEEASIDVTRGPEIVGYHRPAYPGDVTWVHVYAIGKAIRL